MRTSSAPIRHLVIDQRRIERKATAMLAEMMEVDHWPLRQGYNAAGRGQPYDHRQTRDWQMGWRLWQRQHGRAA